MRLFLIIFITLSILIFSLHYQQSIYASLTQPWTEILAKICTALVTTFDDNVHVEGVQILMKEPKENYIGVSIEAGCNGIEACLVLMAAILSFPLPFKEKSAWFYKIRGILYGFFAIQLLNVVRVISLFYLGQWNLDIFEFAHQYAWQILIILDAFVVFLIWLKKIPNEFLEDIDSNPDNSGTKDDDIDNKNINKKTDMTV